MPESSTRTVGLIALDRDVVIEDDLHRMLGPSVKVATTRIPLLSVGSVASLTGLDEYIPDAARLLAASSPTIAAFGCTSGVALIGAERIEAQLRIGNLDVKVLDPLRSIAMGLETLGVERLGLVTPYGGEISGLISGWLQGRGFAVCANVRIDTKLASYALIPAGEIETAVRRATDNGAEGVVIACTDLQVVEVIHDMEAEIGLPIVTSNQALGWSLGKSLHAPVFGQGILFSL